MVPPSPDPYRLLGVARGADNETLRQAWREKAKRYHPDVNGSPGAAEAFDLMRKAYLLLSDPLARARIDDRLRNGIRPQWHDPVPPRPCPAPPRTDTGPDDNRIPRFAFVGLHLTGLAFGLTLVCGVLLQVGTNSWPPITLVFCLPGLVVLPDSWSGLVRNGKAGREARLSRKG